MLGQNNMSNITSVDIGYFVSELGSFDCMLHNSVVIHDIFMQYYRIMNFSQDKVSATRMSVPPF